MYKNIKNKYEPITKINTILLMLIIMLGISNYEVFGYTRGELKGGIMKFPPSQDDNIELLLSSKGYEEPEFDVRIIKVDGELVFLTDGYESFPQEQGSTIVKFNQKYLREYDKIEVRCRDKKDSSKSNVLYLNIDFNEEESNEEYDIKLKRNAIRYQLYDRNGIITDDEKISKDLLDYINNPIVFQGDEIQLKSYPGEEYKLHIYDIERDQWLIHEGDYQSQVSWEANKSGRFILDLWVKSKESGAKYDRWILKPLYVQDRIKPSINLFFSGSQLFNPEDEIVFYFNTHTQDQVQYKAWIIDDNDERTEITNGYTEFMNGNDIYRLKYDGELETGVYKLWIWTRILGDKGYRTSYEGREFVVLEENERSDISIKGDIEFNKSLFYEGETIRVYGMHDLQSPENDIIYKLDIFDVDKNRWIYDGESFQDYPIWIPKAAGQYIISLKIKGRYDDDDQYRKILRPIKVMEKNEKIIKEKNYTIVNTFNELKYAVANDYIFIINNDKVKKAYDQAIKIKNNVIDQGNTTLEKLMLINEYIVKNSIYDTRVFESEYIDDESISIYGILINGMAICQGYSDTTKLFLDMLGIENRVVEGTVKIKGRTVSHVWNIVKLNGKEYYLDTTFNDPIPDRGNKDNYSIFLGNDESIQESHKWDTRKYGTIKNKEYEYFSEMVSPVKNDDWIYYLNKKDRMRLYKIKIDGTQKTKISNETIGEFIIDEEWIFFTSKYGGYIYRINKDGLGPLRLNKEPSINIEEEDGFIKYKNFYDKKYYIINKDGSKKSLYRDKNE